MSSSSSILVALALVACGGGGHKTSIDAAVDGSPDARIDGPPRRFASRSLPFHITVQLAY